MNPITQIKNIIFLYRANKDLNLIKINHYEFYKRAFSITKNNYKGKKSLYRNLLAGLLHKLRKISPYRIQGYSECEKLYKEYFTLENSIQNFEDLQRRVLNNEEIFLYKFREENPIKGNSYSAYHTNWASGKSYVVKLSEYGKKYDDWIKTTTLNGEHSSKIDKDDITMYLFATDEQIRNSKLSVEKRNEIQKEINKLESKISKLYTEKSKY